MYELLKLEQYIDKVELETKSDDKDIIIDRKERELKYTEIALANYLENALGMEILEVKSEFKHGEHDKVTFRTKSTVNGLDEEYIFTGRKYRVEEFKPRGNVLELKEVRKGDLKFELEKKFYLSVMSNKNPSEEVALNSSVENLIEDKVEDKELDLLLKLLNENLENLDGFSCECEPGKADSLNVSVGDDVKITTVFSNSIQVDFKEKVIPIRISYRKRSENELTDTIVKLKEVIENYQSESLLMGSFNVSSVNKYMRENNIHADLNAEIFLHFYKFKSKSNDTDYESTAVPLYSKFVIGRGGKQVEVGVLYNVELDKVEVHLNFLFRESVTSCMSTIELLMVLDRLVKITK